jgi:hypothetical protein
MSANRKRGSKLFLAGHKSRAVRKLKNVGHSVRGHSHLSVSARELPTAPHDHPDESADQTADHHQHKEHTTRKSGTYPIDSAVPRHARWFLATLAGENRGHPHEKQTEQRKHSASHKLNLALVGAAAQERSDVVQYPLHGLR